MTLNQLTRRALLAALTALGYTSCSTKQPDLTPLLYGPLPVDSTAVDPTNVPDLYGPRLAPYNPDITDDKE